MMLLVNIQMLENHISMMRLIIHRKLHHFLRHKDVAEHVKHDDDDDDDEDEDDDMMWLGWRWKEGKGREGWKERTGQESNMQRGEAITLLLKYIS